MIADGLERLRRKRIQLGRRLHFVESDVRIPQHVGVQHLVVVAQEMMALRATGLQRQRHLLRRRELREELARAVLLHPVARARLGFRLGFAQSRRQLVERGGRGEEDHRNSDPRRDEGEFGVLLGDLLAADQHRQRALGHGGAALDRCPLEKQAADRDRATHRRGDREAARVGGSAGAHESLPEQEIVQVSRRSHPSYLSHPTL